MGAKAESPARLRKRCLLSYAAGAAGGVSLVRSQERPIKLGLTTGSVFYPGHCRAVSHLNSVGNAQSTPARQGAAKVISLWFVKHLLDEHDTI